MTAKRFPRAVARALALVLALAPAAIVAADAESGGDRFVGAGTAESRSESARDIFIGGFSARLGHRAQGDAHLAGFSVEIEAPVGRDAYVAGGHVEIDAEVGEDLTAAGFSVELGPGSRVGGNLRLTAGSVVIRGPVAGSALITAGEVELDAPIDGDLRVNAASLQFGPNARVNGRVELTTPEQTPVPARVAEADRVQGGVSSDAPPAAPATSTDAADESWGVGWVVGATAALVLLFLAGLLALALFPDWIERQRGPMFVRAGRTLLLGAIGLAALIGLVPVAALSLVGITVLPLVLLAIVLAWIAAYLMGAYALAMRARAFFASRPAGAAARLVALAVGLLVLAALNGVPVLGWLLNFAVVVFGFGGLMRAPLRSALARAA